MAMSEAEIELAAVETSITEHWPELLKRLPGRELMPTMYSKRLLSDINREAFQAAKTASEQNDIILVVMKTKSCSDFEIFLQIWKKENRNVDILQRLTASYESAKQDIPESDEKKPAISKGSEPTETKLEKMMYGDYIPNFDEKFKRLTSSAKAICRISPDFEQGTTTGFVTKFQLLDGSLADFLVTCIHTFVTAADREKIRDYTSILFPHSHDGAKDQPQQISPAIRKRILNCEYKFWSAETAIRGCDILYEEPGQLNFFADAKNDVVVLRLAASPKGVKPLKFKSEKKYNEARPIKGWYYASVDIFGYFGGADCLEHAKDPKICRNACLRYSQGVVCPEEEDFGRVTSSSDSEEDGSEDTTGQSHLPAAVLSPPRTDYRALKEECQRKMEERRNELRFLYQEQLEFSHLREVQVKMMKQAHREALVEKNLTIEDLSDIICEKEERIAELEGRDFDPELADRGGRIDKVVAQLRRLTRESSQLKVGLELAKADSERYKQQAADKVKMAAPVVATEDRGASDPFSNMEEIKKMIEQDSALFNQLSSLRADKFKLEEEKDCLTQQIEQLHAAMEKASDEHGAQVQTVESLQGESDRTARALQVSKRKEVQLEGMLESCQQEVQLLKETLILSQKENESLQKKMKEDRAFLEEERRNFQQQIASLRHQYQSSLGQTAKEGERRRAKCASPSHLRPHLLSLGTSASSLSLCLSDAKEDMRVFTALVAQQISQVTRKIVLAFRDTAREKEQMVERCREEIQERRRLHQRLAELKGRIRVFARVRPCVAEDGSNNVIATTVDTLDDSNVRLKWRKTSSTKSFVVDRAFGPESSQAEVFSEVHEVVSSVMDGYNVAIFAYGQTGSGKTHTMEGTPEAPGINFHSMAEIFTAAGERAGGWLFCVHVSVVEIYGEEVYDLLGTTSGTKMKIKQGPHGNHVPGLTWVEVKDVEEAKSVFRRGTDGRKTAATIMNVQSSRSHCVVCVHVEGYSPLTGVRTFGKLNLIDLAGSERVARSGATGDRLREAQYINRSLSALGDVLHSLRAKNRHIPYRNSKLTYLLKDSLDGDSKVLLFVQLSPVEASASETQCSLVFAERAMLVELGQAKAHKDKGSITPSSSSSSSV